MCITVLSASIYHMYTWQHGVQRKCHPLEQELQMVVSCYVGAGMKSGSSATATSSLKYQASTLAGFTKMTFYDIFLPSG